MPRYFLDIRDRTVTVSDETGTDYPALADAVREAQKALHEMAADEPGTGNAAVAIDIRDETSRVIATVMASTSVVPDVARE